MNKWTCTWFDAGLSTKSDLSEFNQNCQHGQLKTATQLQDSIVNV